MIAIAEKEYKLLKKIESNFNRNNGGEGEDSVGIDE